MTAPTERPIGRRRLVQIVVTGMVGLWSSGRAAGRPFIPVRPWDHVPSPTDASGSMTTTTTTSTTTTSTTTTSTTTTTTSPTATTIATPAVVETPRGPLPPVSIGTTVQGRAIPMYTSHIDGATHRVMVIGGLHGNEPATHVLARRLLGVVVPDHIDLHVIPEANPDGVAADERHNAAGVDLNRNFPWHWEAHDGGPGPHSEPETQALMSTVELLRPDVVVWIHQPLGYVSSIGTTDQAYADAWRGPAGLPTRLELTQHGGGESWTALAAGIPSMLVEIDTWEVEPGAIDAHVHGFEALLAVLHH